MSGRSVIGLLLLAALAAGCKSPIRMYEGAERERDELARIVPNDIVIHSVDGKPLTQRDSFDRKPIDVLPGAHDIRIEWSMDPGYATHLPAYPRGVGYYAGAKRVGVMDRYRRYFAIIEFEAKAGHTYKGVWVTAEDGRRQPALTDESTR